GHTASPMMPARASGHVKEHRRRRTKHRVVQPSDPQTIAPSYRTRASVVAAFLRTTKCTTYISLELSQCWTQPTCHFRSGQAKELGMRKEYKNPKAKVISSSTNDSSLMTAKALDAYMRFRAKHEGVGYELSPQFFADVIEQGCKKCFGVTFQNGQLVD